VLSDTLVRARPLRPTLLLASAGAILSIFILGIIAWTLYDSYQAARLQAEQHASNVALRLQRDIEHTIDSIDLSLYAAASRMPVGGYASSAPDSRQSVVSGGKPAAEGFAAVFVTDEAGRVIVDAPGRHPANFSIADRNYFRTHQANATLGLTVGQPVKSRYDGKWKLPFSRRIDHSDGSFAGVAFSGLGEEYFQSTFDRIGIGHHGSIALLSLEGLLVARQPFVEDANGRDLRGLELFRRLAQSPAGVFENTDKVDGDRRLYSYRKVGNLPLARKIHQG
jgi:hypothetical protein